MATIICPMCRGCGQMRYSYAGKCDEVHDCPKCGGDGYITPWYPFSGTPRRSWLRKLFCGD